MGYPKVISAEPNGTSAYAGTTIILYTDVVDEKSPKTAAGRSVHVEFSLPKAKDAIKTMSRWIGYEEIQVESGKPYPTYVPSDVSQKKAAEVLRRLADELDPPKQVEK